MRRSVSGGWDGIGAVVWRGGRSVFAALLLGLPAVPAVADDRAVPPAAVPAAPDGTFVTLGTAAGPFPNRSRAQPANALRTNGRWILIDAGDGAVDQMNKAGIGIGDVDVILISHLHFDHTGGLFALIARRFQMLTPGVVTIYGPRGTRGTVDGILRAMAPALSGNSNIQERSPLRPEQSVRVVEIAGGWSGQVDGIAVSAVANTHYATLADAADDQRADTLSYRFDLPGRSIVYTGDTGPSAEVERLARGADLLVAEVMDPDVTLAALRAKRPDTPAPALAAIAAHFEREHLSPRQAGLMAQRAGAAKLVLTHNAIPDAELDRAASAIRDVYHGPTVFARDLEGFE